MIRANHAPYVSKALRKAIMKRSCLENIYFKKKDNHSLKNAKSKTNIAADYIKNKENFFSAT